MKCKFCQHTMIEVEHRTGSFVCVKCGARARLVWDDPDAMDIIERLRRRVAPVLPVTEPWRPYRGPRAPLPAYAVPLPSDGGTIISVYACPVGDEYVAKILARKEEKP